MDLSHAFESTVTKFNMQPPLTPLILDNVYKNIKAKRQTIR